MARRARRTGADPWSTPEERSWVLVLVLWIVDHLGWGLRLFRLDPALFRELLRVRVLLALRPTSAASNAWGVAGVALAILSTGFLGLLTGLVAVLVEDASVWIVASQTGLALLLALVLFQFLANILVDPTDIGVVAPHPVEDRVLFAARLAEVLLFLLLFVASFTAGSMFLAVFAKPPLAVLFLFPLISLLCGLTTLGAVALLFALCLRVVGATHFQRVTLWAQILGGAVVFGGLQLTRIMRHEEWVLWVEQHRTLLLFWPPFQYADLYSWLSGAATPGSPWPSLAALLVPPVALAATLWLASRSFVAGLQGTMSAPTPRAEWPAGTMTRLGARLVSGMERAGFDFAAALSRREPHFLRTVLPNLVMFQAMSVGMGLGMRRDLSFFLPFSAAFLFMVLPNLLLQSQGTAEPEARDVFQRAPLESERDFLVGGIKGLLVQWVGGAALVLFAVHLLVAGLELLPNSVLAFELSFAATLFFTRRYRLGVPFTQPVRGGVSGAENFGLMLLSGLAMVALCVAHAILCLHPIPMWMGIVASAWWLRRLWRDLDRILIAPDKKLHAVRIPLAHG